MSGGARAAAYRALCRCEKDGAWSGAALDAAIAGCGLDGRDGALASRLCLGVLQNRSYLDFLLDACCRGKLEPQVRNLLRLGAYQLLFLDKIPAHAAVSETVSQTRELGLDRAAGLVNAVLRRIARTGEGELPALPEPPAERLALRWSHPLWLVERLLREHDAEFTEGFLRLNNEPSPLTIQLNRLRVRQEDYCRALDRLGLAWRCFPELPGCLELEGGRVTELPGYDEGLFYVQDRAARLAVEAAEIRPGMRVLDACAAPGGKSFTAILNAEGRGDFTACDLHEKKLGLIRAGAERLGLRLNTMARDARTPDPAWFDAFDRVLADVPCSGLGVIRKRPEIRWKRPEELAALPGIQAAILDNLARYVKPGGILLYSTCTVLRAENEAVTDEFLAQHPDFVREPFELPGPIGRVDGQVTLWPQRQGTDGFYICRMRRKN